MCRGGSSTSVMPRRRPSACSTVGSRRSGSRCSLPEVWVLSTLSKLSSEQRVLPRNEHDLADMAFHREVSLRLAHARERIGARDHGPDTPRLDAAEKRGEDIGRRHGRAVHRNVSEIEDSEIDLYDGTGDGPRCDVTSAPADDVEEGWNPAAAHDVGPHVDAFAPDDGFHGAGQIRLFAGNRHVRTESTRLVELGTRRNGDDTRAACPADLREPRADATRGARHEQRLAVTQ